MLLIPGTLSGRPVAFALAVNLILTALICCRSLRDAVDAGQASGFRYCWRLSAGI